MKILRALAYAVPALVSVTGAARANDSAGNLFFIAYGIVGGIMPVLILNSIMIGLHAYPLSQIWQQKTSC
jgi:hypothetical protein